MSDVMPVRDRKFTHDLLFTSKDRCRGGAIVGNNS